MLAVAVAVVLATALGVAVEERTPWGRRGARAILAVMLYVLVPFISFVNFAHLHLSAGGGIGIVLGYIALAFTGVVAWTVARRLLRLSSPAVGALICTSVIVNTGYLGLPLTLAVLGSGPLSSALAYDQLISGPMFLVVGFAVGAIFGTTAGGTPRERIRTYLVRNPPLLAVIAGLIVPASLVPDSLLSVSHGVVIALLPLGFFVVGINLAAERHRGAARLIQAPDRDVVAGVALRLLSAPVILAVASATVIHLPQAYMLQAAMPSGVNSLIVGHAYGLDLRMIATVIVWSTLIVLTAGLVLSVL